MVFTNRTRIGLVYQVKEVKNIALKNLCEKRAKTQQVV